MTLTLCVFIDEPTKSTGLSTVVAVVMVCAVAFLILLTAVIIVAHACKKKAKRSSSKEQDESIYESISDVFTEPMKCDWTPGNAKQSDENVYDEIQAKTIFENTSLFELMDNKAYSSFKPSAAEATS